MLLDSIRLAFGFLTLIPCLPKQTLDLKLYPSALKFFSLVGLSFGLLNLAVIYFHQIHFNNWVTALLIILANVLYSGGLHIDGFMDSFDGLAVSDREESEIARVMKDSRVGAFASMSFSLLLVTQVIFLAQIDYGYLSPASYLVFLFIPAVSRFLVTLIILFQVKEAEIETNSSLHTFKSKSKPVSTITLNLLTMLIFALPLIACFQLRVTEFISVDLFFAASILISWFIYFFLKKKLKSHSGDTMGAGIVLSEVLMYALLFLFK